MVVVLTLFSPLVIEGGMSAESLGFAIGAILLLLAAGRISRETVQLLDRARHDAARDSLTGVLSPGELRDRIDSMRRSRPRAAGGADRDRPRRLRGRQQALRKRRGDRLLAGAARR